MRPEYVQRCHLIYTLWATNPEHRKSIELMCEHIPEEAHLYTQWLCGRWHHIKPSADALPRVLPLIINENWVFESALLHEGVAWSNGYALRERLRQRLRKRLRELDQGHLGVGGPEEVVEELEELPEP